LDHGIKGLRKAFVLGAKRISNYFVMLLEKKNYSKERKKKQRKFLS
jgi:hypothetical protein